MFMTTVRKSLALGFAAMLTAGLVAGCNGEKSANSGSGAQKQYKVGIVQLVEHSALDAANKGFVEGLKKRGLEEGKNLTIDRQNAQADQSNLQNIGQRFLSNKVEADISIACFFPSKKKTGRLCAPRRNFHHISSNRGDPHCHP